MISTSPLSTMRVKRHYLLALSVLILATLSSLAQVPRRKAIMGAQGRETARGILVDTVFLNSTLSAAGLRKGDIIIAINDKQTKTLQDYQKATSSIRTGETTKIQYYHKEKAFVKSIAAVEKPIEVSATEDIIYDWVPFRKGHLRVITRKPRGKNSMPAILMISGYNCGSIENYSRSYNGPLMAEWNKAGFTVVTIEKSGVGDSEGCAPCTEVDLATDIESFDAGYRYMEQLPFVDKARLFIWGHSMGGTIAPEVAKRHSPKGVMVFASVFRPWNEFLLEMHRVQKPLLENLTYQQTEKFVREIQPVYSAFFNEKKTPKEIIESEKYSAEAKQELGYKPGSNDMWGRHWRFWQQLDSINLAESWKQVNCRVLIIHGGADYEQCSSVEPMLTQKTVNEAHANTATLVTIPDLDHFMMKSPDWNAAARNFREQQYLKGNFNYSIVEETLKWMNGL